MNHKTPHLKASGLFILIGLVIVLFSIIVLGGDRFILTPLMTLKIKVPEAQGLGKGSVVSLSGMNIGNVKNIEFSGNSNEIILSLRVNKEFNHKLTEQTQFSLQTQGALGDRYIYLEPGLGGKQLNDGDFITKKGSAGFLDKLSGKNGIEQVFELVAEIKSLVKSINEGQESNSSLVDHLKSSSKSLDESLRNLNILISSLSKKSNTENVSEILSKLKTILSKVEKGQGTLGALINDSSLHNRLLEILGSQKRSQFIKRQIRDVIKSQEEN